MPKSKSIHKYPEDYISFAMKMEADPTRTISLACPSPREAIALRFDIYAFRKALDAAQPGAFPNFSRASMIVREHRLIIQAPEKDAIKFIEETEPHSPPHQFTPSLADAPPSSTYQGPAVVKEFEDLIDNWMNKHD